MHELGLLNELLKLPHQEVNHIGVQIGDDQITFADFPLICRRTSGFIALMPQWDFLDVLARQGAQYPGSQNCACAPECDGPHRRGRTHRTLTARHTSAGRSPGGTGKSGRFGTDGRSSVVREKADLKIDEIGAPMDVLWFALARLPSDPEETMGRIDRGRFFIMIDRGDHWQCGFVIPQRVV